MGNASVFISGPKCKSMMKDDLNIDNISAKWMGKAGLDEPSVFFTDNVMQHVLELSQAKPPINKFVYLWYLLFIPVLIAGGWYLSTIPEFMLKISTLWKGIQDYYLTLNIGLANTVHHIKSITISPIIVLGFLAVLSLLIIEDIFSKTKTSSNNSF